MDVSDSVSVPDRGTGFPTCPSIEQRTGEACPAILLGGERMGEFEREIVVRPPTCPGILKRDRLENLS